MTNTPKPPPPPMNRPKDPEQEMAVRLVSVICASVIFATRGADRADSRTGPGTELLDTARELGHYINGTDPDNPQERLMATPTPVITAGAGTLRSGCRYCLGAIEICQAEDAGEELYGQWIHKDTKSPYCYPRDGDG